LLINEVIKACQDAYKNPSIMQSVKIEWHQFHYESLSSTLRSTLWTIESLNAPVLCCSFSRKA
ncbi:hypothetical protein, partial [Klebsiella pneumoniae]|uniref:hypothetical protein n=1 Tax=Klebsiella pneumoniae TaxID=573 RepID=UPI001B8B0043